MFTIVPLNRCLLSHNISYLCTLQKLILFINWLTIVTVIVSVEGIFNSLFQLTVEYYATINIAFKFHTRPSRKLGAPEDSIGVSPTYRMQNGNPTPASAFASAGMLARCIYNNCLRRDFGRDDHRQNMMSTYRDRGHGDRYHRLSKINWQNCGVYIMLLNFQVASHQLIGTSTSLRRINNQM